uniref:Peptidase n=1 Tax=uncultured bacterium BLR5 TaxID=506522 RepID=B5L5W8_9BACT|nr:peptidase [uncultured bacterium BLR5]
MTTHSPVPDVDEMTIQTRPGNAVQSSSGQVAHADRQRSDPSQVHQYSIQRTRIAERLETLIPWLSVAWFFGVLGLTARVTGGMIYTQRLIRCHTQLFGSYWTERLKHVSKRLRLSRSVRLLESSVVKVPTTIGWWRPVILVPGSVLSGLTPQQLELILAHELAHIRRHDYLINLFQVLVETLLFYHPAVWWISKQVRNERELVCDDMAVSVGGDPITYARALAKIERLRRETPVWALAADGGRLSKRIVRLIDSTQDSPRLPSMVVGFIMIGALFISIAVVQNVLSITKRSAQVAVAGATSVHQQLTPQSVQELIALDDTTGEDSEVRRISLAALGKREGAVIVMDPRTGRVYTIVNQEWAVRQSWQPASIIKLVTAAAALGEKVIQPSQPLRVSAKSRPLDLTEALALSSNPYFAFVGNGVGPDQIIKYAREFGLGERTGINYSQEGAGIIPGFSENLDVRFGATGEGVEATPIQLATLVSAVANGGQLVTPYVPHSSAESSETQPPVRRRIAIPPANLGLLMAGMIAAVDHGSGTGASDTSQIVAGKTGTFRDKTTNVGLFASYAPANDPRFVVVVVTRGQNESGPEAANVAGTIFRGLRNRS